MKGDRRSLSGLLELILLLFAWGMRLYRLGFQSIWWDEGRNINAAMQPLSVIPHAPAVDIHPPLYFYALHFWLQLGGHTEFAVRFLSTIFGFLTLPILYRLGKELFDEDTARFVLLLGGIAPFFVGEAQEARMYTLAFLWITLAALALWRAWKNPAGIGYWLLFGVASALSMLTHYSSIFVLAAFYFLACLAAIDGASKKDWSPVVGVVVSIVAGVLLFSPQASTFWHQVYGYYNRNLTPPGVWRYLYRCWQAFTLGENVSPAWVERWTMPLWMLIVPGVLLAIVKYRKRGIDPWAFVATWIVLPLGIYYWQVLKRGAFEPRYISFIAPAWWLVLAASMSGYLKTRRWAGVVVLLFFLGAILPALRSDLTDPRYFRDDTRGLAEFLMNEAKEGDVIVVDAPFPLQFYYPRFSEDTGKVPEGQPNEAPAYYLFANVHTVDRKMRSIAYGKNRVFLVHWYKSDADPRGIVKFLVNKYGSLQGKRDFRGYHVEWYSVPTNAEYKVADRWKALNVRFQGGLILKSLAYGGHGADVNGKSLPADRPAWVALNWSVSNSVDLNLKASVFLEDRTGHKIGQDDRKLLNDRHLGTRYWKPGQDALNVHLIFPYPASAPGKYHLKLTVYDPRSGKAVPVLDSAGAPKGTTVDIGEIELEPPIMPPKGASPSHPVTEAGESPLHLLGYDGELGSASPGSDISLRLYWQCGRCGSRNFKYSLLLESKGSEIPVAEGESVSNSELLADSWRKGEIVAPWYSWKVPPTVSSGVYELRICWGDAGHGCAAGSILGELKVSGRPHVFKRPKFEHGVDARFGEVAKLVGYSIYKPQRDDGKLKVVLVWQALSSAKKPYKVFVHVLNSSGKLISQRDSEPCDGKCPTTGWLPGEYIRDEYMVPRPTVGWKDASWLEIGLYDPESGKRVVVTPPALGNALRLPLR